MGRWEACPAMILIEGRGLVRCWFPPSPGRMLCRAHHPGPDAAAGESELRAFVTALLKQIDTRVELSEFIKLPAGPHYELRVGVPGGMAKWVIVPEGMVRRAPFDLPAHRVLRDLLASIIHVQQGQRSRRGLPVLELMASSRDPAAGAARKWILVADDDDAVRELWTEILRLNGYHVLTARNGLEALEVMGAVVPDLILLDLRMPEISGPTFLTMLEGSPVLRRLPVLIVSAFLGDEPPRGSLWLNIVGRLSKPLHAADLLGAVQAALVPTARPVG